jgi:hypothetical protein
MTFTDAAAEVLRLLGRPLHYKEITDIAIEKNLLSHVGKSPEVTMGARLAAMLKKDSSDTPLIRVKPGVFALREWDEKTLRAGADGKKGRSRGRQDAHARRPEAQVGDDAAATEAVDDDSADDAADGASLDTTSEQVEEVVAAPAPVAAAQYDDDDDDDIVDAAPAPVPVVAPVAPVAHVAHVPPPAPRASAPSHARIQDDDTDAEPAGPDDVMRAEAVAGAAEMFDEEEDDDQPILGGGDERPGAGAVDGADGRRRRRRRRRGRSTNGEQQPGISSSSGALPSYIATPAFDNRGREHNNFGRDVSRDAPRDSRDVPRDVRDSRDSRDGRDSRDMRDSRDSREPIATEAVYRGPQVIEIGQSESHTALDDLAGRELADAVTAILSTFDRNAGAVSLRQIAETAQRRGRLAGDAQLVQSQVAAAVRADNARRIAAGQRPRFRFAGGRVALTDWLLSGDLVRLEQEALSAVERYRDGARRAFARKLAELPGHAFIEICVLALERMGVGQLRAIRRAGAPGAETHFSGMLKTSGEEVRLAIIIRRDGREIGRERVTELRGSLHHYAQATIGWIFTAGQILSGARDEAAITGTAPVALYDGLSVARLCEDNDVAVIRARLPIAIPDIDLLEALRAS